MQPERAGNEQDLQMKLGIWLQHVAEHEARFRCLDEDIKTIGLKRVLPEGMWKRRFSGEPQQSFESLLQRVNMIASDRSFAVYGKSKPAARRTAPSATDMDVAAVATDWSQYVMPVGS